MEGGEEEEEECGTIGLEFLIWILECWLFWGKKDRRRKKAKEKGDIFLGG